MHVRENARFSSTVTMYFSAIIKIREMHLNISDRGATGAEAASVMPVAEAISLNASRRSPPIEFVSSAIRQFSSRL